MAATSAEFWVVHSAMAGGAAATMTARARAAAEPFNVSMMLIPLCDFFPEDRLYSPTGPPPIAHAIVFVSAAAAVMMVAKKTNEYLQGEEQSCGKA
jgi:hypothetical protein